MGFSDAFSGSFNAMNNAYHQKEQSDWFKASREHQQQEWARQDAARSQLGALASDVKNGVVVPGTDNSPDIAEDKRLGMPPRDSTIQRQMLKNSDIEGRFADISLGMGDVQGYRSARDKQKGFTEDEMITDAMKADPPPELAKYINSNHKQLTVGEPDKKGFRQLSVVRPDGSAMFMNLSKADQQKLYAADKLMQQNPTRAMQMIKEVNGELAASLATDNNMTDKMATNQNAGAYHSGQLDNQSRQLDNQARQIESMDQYHKGMLGVARNRASQENAAMNRLGMGDKLGQEAAGYAEGMMAARAAGSKEGEAIYGQKLAGVNSRLAALGLRPFDPLQKAKPGYKFDAGSGMYHDESGAPIARRDDQYGMIPLGDDPRQSMSKPLKEAVASGVALQVIERGGVPQWGYQSADGDMYTSLGEAMKASIAHGRNQKLAERGLMSRGAPQPGAMPNFGPTRLPEEGYMRANQSDPRLTGIRRRSSGQ